MLFSLALLVLTVLTIPVLVLLSMRRWGQEEAETEARLMAPDAHAVKYVVPEGQDPVLVRAALAHAGFVSVLDTGGDQRLLVQCEPGQRSPVREAIESVGHPELAGDRVSVTHAHFEDEPA